MDPVTLGAVLLAIVSGAAGELGSRLWDKVSALVRVPFQHGRSPVGGGVAELTALAGAPNDRDLALVLAHALVARAGVDAEFGRALGQWWEQASQVRTGEGSVTSVISGGTQHGPVLQGRDFTGLTFGPTSSSAPSSAGQ